MAVINFPVFPSFHNAQSLYDTILHVYKKEREKFHVKKKPNQKNEKYYYVLKSGTFFKCFY